MVLVQLENETNAIFSTSFKNKTTFLKQRWKNEPLWWEAPSRSYRVLQLYNKTKKEKLFYLSNLTCKPYMQFVKNFDKL